ncbi:MAG: hypothetical protein HY684_04850 [Chloroflexi bacterium]|nr:hypothetical protein [Chloroflexota bacterium]
MRTLYLVVAILIILAMIITLFPPLVGAQGQPITVVGEQVKDLFPDGMNFTLEARAERSIKTVELRLLLRGARGPVIAQPSFDKGATTIKIDYTHRRIGSGRYYPPGQDVTYSYRITDEAGNVLETQPQAHTYLDPRIRWETLSDGFITVYYHGGLRTRAQTILQATQETMDRVSKVLETQLKEPIRLVVYNSYVDMAPALPFVSATYESALMTEGQAYFEQGVLLLFGGDPNIRGVTSHESTHLLVHQAASSPLAQIPPWLDEGLAEYGNIQPGAEYDRALQQGIRANSLIPLRNLAARPGNPNAVILFYGQGRSAVRFMIETYGAPKMAALLRVLNDGLRIDEALRKVYSMGLDELDNAWRKSIGAAPLPLATPTPSTPPTPEAIPTLAPFSGPPVSPPIPASAPPVQPTPPASSPAQTQADRGSPGGLACNPRAGESALDPAAIVLFGLPGLLLALRRRR